MAYLLSRRPRTEGHCGWSSPKGTRSRKRNWRAYARSGDGSGKSWQPSLWPARRRAYLRKLSWQYEREEIQATRSRQAGNWLDFLRDKAIRGDETALAILRSRQEVVAPERAADQQEVGNSPLAKETKILENAVLSPQRKRCLTSVALMEKIVPGVQASITTHGNIVYRLPQGGKVMRHRQADQLQPGSARNSTGIYVREMEDQILRDQDKAGDTVYTLTGGRQVIERGGGHRFELVPPESGQGQECPSVQHRKIGGIKW